MSTSRVRDIVLGGLFVALALVLPVFFHAFGLGAALLPMHIPVFLAGFFVSPWAAAVIGMVSPMLSATLTGMPPLSPPIAQAMTFELGVYGLVTSLAYRATGRVLVSWAVAAVSGRLASGIAGAVILPLFGFTGVPFLYPLSAGVVAGLPGLALQAVLVPGIIYLVNRVLPQATAPARAGGRPR